MHPIARNCEVEIETQNSVSRHTLRQLRAPATAAGVGSAKWTTFADPSLRPARPLVVFVDCARSFVDLNRGALWSSGYDYQIARDCNHALTFAAGRQLGAFVVTCAADAARLMGRWTRISPATPIVLLNRSNAGPSGGVVGNLVIDEVSSIEALIQLLDLRLTYKKDTLLTERRYQLIQLEWPLSILADRDGEVICFGGVTLSMSDAGLWGRIVGEFTPGETVLISCDNAPEDPFLRAEVRCRSGDIYGFVFHKGYFERLIHHRHNASATVCVGSTGARD